MYAIDIEHGRWNMILHAMFERRCWLQYIAKIFCSACSLKSGILVLLLVKSFVLES